MKTILKLGLFQPVAYFYFHRDCIHCIYVLFSNFDCNGAIIGRGAIFV